MESTVDTALKYLLFVTRRFNQAELSDLIMGILIDLGFTPGLDGFEHLREAIELKVNDRSLRLAAIYQCISDAHGGAFGYFQIDQAIRSQMKSVWENNRKDKWIGYFPDFDCEHGKRPSNSNFISYMACYIRLIQVVRKEGNNETK